MSDDQIMNELKTKTTGEMSHLIFLERLAEINNVKIIKNGSK